MTSPIRDEELAGVFDPGAAYDLAWTRYQVHRPRGFVLGVLSGLAEAAVPTFAVGAVALSGGEHAHRAAFWAGLAAAAVLGPLVRAMAMRAWLDLARDQPPRIATPLDVGVTLLLADVACLVGLVLGILPGLWLRQRLRYAGYFSLDQGMGPFAAMRASFRTTKHHAWRLWKMDFWEENRMAQRGSLLDPAASLDQRFAGEIIHALAYLVQADRASPSIRAALDPQPEPASRRTPLFDPIAAHAAIPKEAPTPQPSVYVQGAVNIAKATTRAAAAVVISGMIDGSDSGDGGSGD